jgi:hypothetical protein
MLALDQMRLQNKLDIQNYKKKLQLQQEADQGQNNTAAMALANVASDTVPALLNYFNDQTLVGKDAEGNKLNYVSPAAAVAAWAADNGVVAGDPQYQVALAAAQAIRSSNDANGGSYDPADISAAVSQQLAIMYGDLKPAQLTALQGIVMASAGNWDIGRQQATATGTASASTGTTGNTGKHEVYERDGDHVRDILGNNGIVKEDGSILWISG